MKRAGLFAATVAALIAAIAWLVTLAVRGDGASRAVWLSAGLAFVVQCAAFALARAAPPGQLMIGWGAGMLVRFLSIAAYALVGVKVLELAQAPALLAFAGFLFVTTLVEPVFLK